MVAAVVPVVRRTSKLVGDVVGEVALLSVIEDVTNVVSSRLYSFTVATYVATLDSIVPLSLICLVSAPSVAGNWASLNAPDGKHPTVANVVEPFVSTADSGIVV